MRAAFALLFIGLVAYSLLNKPAPNPSTTRNGSTAGNWAA
jgi:hypothetical protein